MPEPEAFDWNKLFAGLLSHGLKPGDLSELTFTEALLYSVSQEAKSLAVKEAEYKARLLAGLPVEDRIALARLRTGG